MMKKDQRAFIKELIKSFPEINEQVLDEDSIDLIHIQIGAFAAHTQNAIDGDNTPIALKCFQFVDDIIEDVESNIEDALEISWIFHLSFKRNEDLFELFPQKLKKIRTKWETIEHDLYLLNNPLLKAYLDKQAKGL